MTRPIPLAIASLGLLAACAKDAPPQPPRAASSAPTTTAASGADHAAARAADVPSLHLGEPISAPAVALADVAAHSADYVGKTFSTSGTVTAVCQEMGCWMEIKDDSGQAHVRMHGHSFFLPKTAAGHHARIQATLDPTKGDEEDLEEAKKQMGHPAAKLSLDATGVELD